MPTLPFAIGDLQGCCSDLQGLLNALRYQEHERPIWCVGDLVNRGPQSLKTLRLLMSLGERVQVVLGNHDLHLLAMAAGVRKLNSKDTASEILNAPDAKTVLDWVRQQPLAIFKHNHLMVHAGLYPWWSIAELLQLTEEVHHQLRGPNWIDFLTTIYGNTPTHWHPSLKGSERSRFIINACTRMRLVDSSGQLELISKEGAGDYPAGFRPWFEHPNLEQVDSTIVFGHWSTQGLVRYKNVIGLDTGCVWGGQLSAMDLQTRELIQVSCEQHQAPG